MQTDIIGTVLLNRLRNQSFSEIFFQYPNDYFNYSLRQGDGEANGIVEADIIEAERSPQRADIAISRSSLTRNWQSRAAKNPRYFVPQK